MAKPPKWEEDFSKARRKDGVRAMKRALALGLPINQPVKSLGNLTSLHAAVTMGVKPEVVQVLLDAGADVNCRADAAEPPLCAAAEDGRVDLVKLLLAAGADVHAKDGNLGFTALSLACLDKTAKHENVIRELLAAGAKPTIEDLVEACAAGEPFTSESTHGNPAVVRMLVEAGVDVNGVASSGLTPLHRVAEDNNVTIAEVLLSLGADPTRRTAADDEDYPNKTPLDIAREWKAKKVVALLEAVQRGQLPQAAPAPAPPPVTAKIPDLWRRLEAALSAAAPQVKKTLRRGAAEAKLAKQETALGWKLPAAVRSSYLLHDGQTDDADGLFPEGFGDLDCDYFLMPFSEVLSEWKMWKGLVEEGEFEDRTANPDDGVRDDWWNVGWLPLAANGAGDLLCVDLKPAKGGSRGQIISMSHESGDRLRLASSLAELLQQLCQHYEEAAEGD